MKKYFIITLAALAFFASCSKDNDSPSKEVVDPETQPVAGEVVTINAELSDVLTKVAFDPIINTEEGTDKGKITGVSLKWELTDKLLIADSADPTNSAVFDLVSTSADGKRGGFSGTLPAGATTYNISVVDGKSDSGFGTQTQPSDGVSNVKYWAEATNVAPEDLSDFTLSHQSGVLAFTVKMPSTAAAAGVMSMDITSSEDIFYGGNSLTLRFDEAGDAGSDGILYFFATLPASYCTTTPASTLLVHLNAPGTDHTVYTRLIELSAGTFTAGKVNTININATQSATHAGKTTDNGTTANPYLIGDKYQLASVNGLLDGSMTKCFKLIDDIDMSDESWSSINPSSPYKSIELDGNGKTISNLGNSLLYVFKGSVKNLTLDHCTASNGTQRGIFAQYVQGDGEQTITNVDVINGTVSAGNGCMGGLIGRINNPSGGTTTATITDCDVTNTSVTGKQNGTGGLIGSVESVVTVSNTNVKGTTVTGNDEAVAVGGIIGTVTSASTFENCTFDKNGGTAAKVTGPTKTGTATTSETAYGPGNVYVGGIAGEVSGAASFDDCHVKNATVTVKTPTSNTSYWKNVGGAFGYIHNANAKIGETTGCSVENVSVPAHHWAAGFVSAMGGGTIKNSTVTGLTISGQNFVGGFVSIINAGTISDCSVSGNAIQNANATIAGFAAYVYGVATLKDNSTSLQLGDSSHKLGTNLGGFAGQVVAAASFEGCSASGNIYSTGGSIGGFAGYVTAGSFTSCHASGDVSTTGNSVGGLLGKVALCTVSKCFATGDVEGGQYVGGIIGQALPANSTTISVSESYYSKGTVSATSYAGGLVGITYQGGNTGSLTITNCYMAGDVSVSGQWAGGILGSHYKGIATLENCYDTGSVTGSFGLGGIVGYVNANELSVTRCFPFNSSISATNTDGDQHYSSGAVIGYGKDKTLVVNVCYRVSDMASRFNDCTGNAANVVEQHGFITSAATIPQRKSLTYGYYHHGRNTAYSLCNLVHSGAIGEDWSSTIWDWSGSRPVLNGNKEILE